MSKSGVIYSIFHKQPKRASLYWFLHIDITDEPDTFNYKATQIIPGILTRIDFYLGFKVELKINLYFRQVLEDLSVSGEIKLESSYESLRKRSFPSDFTYIFIDRIMVRDYKLSTAKKVILFLHNISRLLSISDLKALHLDPSMTIEEKVPILVDNPSGERIKRSDE